MIFENYILFNLFYGWQDESGAIIVLLTRWFETNILYFLNDFRVLFYGFDLYTFLNESYLASTGYI